MSRTRVCSICKKEEYTNKILRCNECNNEICEYCFVDPFCIDHYKGLIPENYLKLKQLIRVGTNKRDKLERLRKRVAKIAWIGGILLTIFIYWLIFSYIRIYPSLMMFIMICTPFTLLYPPLLTLVKYEDKRKKYYNELKLEKEKIL